MNKLFVIVGILAMLTGCETKTVTESEPQHVAETAEAPDTKSRPEQEARAKRPAAEPAAEVETELTTATESSDVSSSAPIVEGVSPQTLSTREPIGLTINGHNLATATAKLVNDQGVELALDIFEQTDSSIIVPDTMYPEDKSGVYNLVVRSDSGEETVFPAKITITNEK